MDVFVARQAIFDASLSLFGYELLFRSCQENRSDSNADSATLQVLANSLLSSGLESIAGNSPVFINFGQELLKSGWTCTLPPESVVIEILETVNPDPDVLASCQQLREMGYQLALDDVVGSDRDNRLLEFVSFVKVDFRATTREQQAALAKQLKGSGKRLVAEKVETQAEFTFAREAGYDLFQGFFFARPALLRGRQLPSAKVNGLRLMRELQSQELNFKRIEAVIQSDVSLTYKLFRYVNSALFARRKRISNIREALMIMGEVDVRRWMTLATLPGLAAGKCEELIVHALVRARFCELLATEARLSAPADLFLIGLFSMLEALIESPLPAVLAELALPDDITVPLLNTDARSREARLYSASLAYEMADWKGLQEKVEALGLPQDVLADQYLQAIAWAGEMLGGVLGEPSPSNRSNAPTEKVNSPAGKTRRAPEQRRSPAGEPVARSQTFGLLSTV